MLEYTNSTLYIDISNIEKSEKILLVDRFFGKSKHSIIHSTTNTLGLHPGDYEIENYASKLKDSISLTKYLVRRSLVLKNFTLIKILGLILFIWFFFIDSLFSFICFNSVLILFMHYLSLLSKAMRNISYSEGLSKYVEGNKVSLFIVEYIVNSGFRNSIDKIIKSNLKG